MYAYEIRMIAPKTHFIAIVDGERGFKTSKDARRNAVSYMRKNKLHSGLLDVAPSYHAVIYNGKKRIGTIEIKNGQNLWFGDNSKSLKKVTYDGDLVSY